jgi:hypothetical protein
MTSLRSARLRSALLYFFSEPRLFVLSLFIDEPVMPSVTSPLRSAPLRSALLCFSAPRLLILSRLIDEPLMPSATSPLCSALLLGATSACLASSHRRAGNAERDRSALFLGTASADLVSPHRRTGDAERNIPALLCSASRRRVCSSCLVSSTNR